MYFRPSWRRDLAGGEPLDAHRHDVRGNVAGLHLVGVAAEQDAVAREVHGDVLEAEAGLGELQPFLLVHPDGQFPAEDDGLHPLAPNELPRASPGSCWGLPRPPP